MSNQMEMFRFLNRLRESGKTNMFGAGPYVAQAFGMTDREARKVLTAWMDWANEDPENLNV
jgi:hypothetical protein